METAKEWFVKTADGKVYGPADMSSLLAWAADGRVDATVSVSKDRIRWTPAEMIDELELKWVVEAEPGRFLGPYNRQFLISSCADGALTASAKMFCLHELPIDEDPPPQIVEKIVEVPVEKIVEKIVEKRVEVPVEKIVEKIVEVEPPIRETVIEAEVLDPVDTEPPPRAPGGFLKGANRARLAALEEAARRELAAAGKSRFGFFGRK